MDSSFVEGITVPFLFMLGGIEWKAEKINMQRWQVIAKRTRVGEAPSWSVFMGGDVPLETAKEAGRLLFGDDMPDFLDDEGREGIAAARDEVCRIGWRDGKWIIAVPETSKGKAYIWTFAGDRINRTLALLLESSGIGKAVANYKYVEVKPAERSDKLLPGKIEWLLAYYKQPALAEFGKESLPVSGAHGFSIPDYSKDVLSGSHVAGKRVEEVMRETRRRFEFSKFSKCLPDDLWAAAMVERTMDLEGLKRELEKSIVSFT